MAEITFYAGRSSNNCKAAAKEATPEAAMYAGLYLGLYYEAAGEGSGAGLSSGRPPQRAASYMQDSGQSPFAAASLGPLSGHCSDLIGHLPRERFRPLDGTLRRLRNDQRQRTGSAFADVTCGVEVGVPV